jgi:hypothetical protein
VVVQALVVGGGSWFNYLIARRKPDAKDELLGEHETGSTLQWEEAIEMAEDKRLPELPLFEIPKKPNEIAEELGVVAGFNRRQWATVIALMIGTGAAAWWFVNLRAADKLEAKDSEKTLAVQKGEIDASIARLDEQKKSHAEVRRLEGELRVAQQAADEKKVRRLEGQLRVAQQSLEEKTRELEQSKIALASVGQLPPKSIAPWPAEDCSMPPPPATPAFSSAAATLMASIMYASMPGNANWLFPADRTPLGRMTPPRH